MIPSQVLAMIRAQTNRSLTETCDIQSRSLGTDDYGTPAQQWVTAASGVSCRVVREDAGKTSQGQRSGERSGLEDSWRVILPAGTTVASGYRVVLASGEIYNVKAIQDDLSDEVFVSVLVERER